jgi:hypothetical protein
MKYKLYLFSILFATFFIVSCNDGNKVISEIKLIPVKNGNDYQFIDKEGKIAINPQFSEATIFRDLNGALFQRMENIQFLQIISQLLFLAIT